MKSGTGYWLDPRNGNIYEVVTHNDWLLDGENQVKVGLTPKQIRVLESLDPAREIDEIRMIGIMAGLVRARDYRKHLGIQFFSAREEVDATLNAIENALPILMPWQEHFLVLHNLADDSFARLWSGEFTEILQAGNSVLNPAEDVVEYNEKLRRKMKELLT